MDKIMLGWIAIYVVELVVITLLIRKLLKRKKKRKLQREIQVRMKILEEGKKEEPEDKLLAFRKLFSQSKDGGEAI